MTDQRQIGGLAVDMKISLGNIIVIGTLVVAIAVGWSKMTTEGEQNKTEIARAHARIDKLEVSSSDTKDRLTRLEVIMQGMSQQLDRAVRLLERNPLDPGRGAQ